MSDTLTVLPPNTPVADILDAAADAMALRGKCVGDYTDDQGQVCALGALRLVLTGRADPEPVAAEDRDRQVAYLDATRTLRQYLEAVDVDAPAVYEWSDDHPQAEVVAGMRAAAERARTVQQ